jgi:hypothetical protein
MTVGVDETASIAATASSPTEFVTGIVNLTRRRFVDGRSGVAGLLDVVEGRSAAALSCWIAEREPGWQAAVTAADPVERIMAAAVVVGPGEWGPGGGHTSAHGGSSFTYDLCRHAGE